MTDINHELHDIYAMAMQQRPIILASTSPYRKTLLERLQLPFMCMAPEVDESPQVGETPLTLSERLALAKAEAIADELESAIVIGSDQVADLNGQALGKPGNHERAVAQLQTMRGQTLVFHTSVAVVCRADNFCQRSTASVRVRFRQLSDAAIEQYLRAEQPYDCAGSAKSEGLGIALLESIESDDPSALIGLPLMRTAAMLRAAGVAIY